MPNLPLPVATSRVHKMRFGAEVTSRGTRSKIWAPKCKAVGLTLKRRRSPIALERQDEGWHRKEVEGVAAGAHYRFVLPGGTEIADPASRHEPADIDGNSEVIDPAAYVWRDDAWRGRPWEEAVIYELHVGAFTRKNHDQIGNRIKGNRICTIASEDAVLAMASVYLLAPQVPMLFMGEEWGADEAFPFFSDLPEDLREITRKGRIEELKKTLEHDDPDKPGVEEAVDPTDIATFRSAKLDRSILRRADARKRLQFYRTLTDVRHREIVPRLVGTGGFASGHETLGDNAVLVGWRLGDGSTLRLYLNLCGESLDGPHDLVGRQIWLQGFAAEGRLGPWTAAWTIAVDDA